jgi:hypothetical protein
MAVYFSLLEAMLKKSRKVILLAFQEKNYNLTLQSVKIALGKLQIE